ncbi:MAG: glycoside hydrolase family 11 protein [Oscillospiraceae bacterium]|nr:glycoside hydrolase family 11 protein [Oscillospiraceae bacterium]
MNNNNKRILAFLVAMLMCVSIFGGMTAFASLNYHQNWTSDLGNGPISGTRTGNQGTVTFNGNLSTGNFTVSWRTSPTNSGYNNLQGLGWSTGTSSRRIGYNLGVFNHTSGSNGCTYGCVYGWARSPQLYEYYVVDNWVNYGNTSGSHRGSLTSDGGTYNIYTESTNGPNINGSGPFFKIKSVRTSQRPTGQNNVVTFQNHINAWASQAGVSLSNHDYQAYIIEGYNSAGNANATVWAA